MWLAATSSLRECSGLRERGGRNCSKTCMRAIRSVMQLQEAAAREYPDTETQAAWERYLHREQLLVLRESLIQYGGADCNCHKMYMLAGGLCMDLLGMRSPYAACGSQSAVAADEGLSSGPDLVTLVGLVLVASTRGASSSCDVSGYAGDAGDPAQLGEQALQHQQYASQAQLAAGGWDHNGIPWDPSAAANQVRGQSGAPLPLGCSSPERQVLVQQQCWAPACQRGVALIVNQHGGCASARKRLLLCSARS